jgi:hypothetical protein
MHLIAEGTQMAATGNYRRRIEDIPVAIKTLDDRAALLDAANFLVLYFACEKLAKSMIGIDEDEPVEQAFDRRYMPTERIKKAASKAAITFSDDEITRLFEYQKVPKEATSGRALRDRAVHDFGPTNIGNAARRGKILTDLMRKFLACDQQILRYLDSQNARTPHK